MLSCFASAACAPAEDALRLPGQLAATSLAQVKQAHARALRSSGFSHDPALLPSLLRLYSSHRRLDLAARLLATSPDPPPIAWNLMIRAYAAGGAPLDAVLLYNRMLASGVRPDKFTFPFVLKACSILSDIGKGKEVHAFAIKSGFSGDRFLRNALIHLYLRCGHPVCGRKVFDGMPIKSVVSWTALLSGLISCGEIEAARGAFEAMPVRNVVTWTAMIDWCARNGRPDEAFRLFRRMQEDNVRPNEFTMVSLLIACTEIGSLRLGRWVHEFAQKNGGLDRGVYVGTALVDMYSKCGSLEDAQKVFDHMPDKSLATWNSMITSMGVHGHGKEAVALFQEMEKANIRPDGITFVGVLCACVRECLVEEGFRFFCAMIQVYGIEPCREHYDCIKELLDDEDNSGEVTEIVQDLLPGLDARTKQILMRLCEAHGVLKTVEAAVNCGKNESDSVADTILISS